MAYQNKLEMMWVERFMMVLLAIVMLGTFIMMIYSGKLYYQQSATVQLQIATHYQIPQESVIGLQCYKGFLHYPNLEFFSGLLNFSPGIQCDKSELEALKKNPFQAEFYLSVCMFLFSTGLGWLHRKLN